MTALMMLNTGAATTELAVKSRHSTSYDVLAIEFDPLSGRHLAVAGLRGVQVLYNDVCCL